MDSRATVRGQPAPDLPCVSSVHWHAASREVVYRVRLHPVGGRSRVGPEGDADIAFRPGRPGAVSVRSPAGSGRDLSDISAASRGREIELKIPLRLLGNPRTLFVAVESRFQGIMIDQTMWRVLDLNGAFGTEPDAPG